MPFAAPHRRGAEIFRTERRRRAPRNRGIMGCFLFSDLCIRPQLSQPHPAPEPDREASTRNEGAQPEPEDGPVDAQTTSEDRRAERVAGD